MLLKKGASGEVSHVRSWARLQASIPWITFEGSNVRIGIMHFNFVHSKGIVRCARGSCLTSWGYYLAQVNDATSTPSQVSFSALQMIQWYFVRANSNSARTRIHMRANDSTYPESKLAPFLDLTDPRKQPHRS